MSAAASPAEKDVRARLGKQLIADGLKSARALVGNGSLDAGCCARAAELTRTIQSSNESRRAERTATALQAHVMAAAAVAVAAAAAAEADLLSATVGAEARLAAVAKLSRSCASDLIDARLTLEAATQAKASRAAQLVTALQKGLTPQLKLQWGAKFRAKQQEAANTVARLEAETAEALELSHPVGRGGGHVKPLSEQLVAAKLAATALKRAESDGAALTPGSVHSARIAAEVEAHIQQHEFAELAAAVAGAVTEGETVRAHHRALFSAVAGLAREEEGKLDGAPAPTGGVCSKLLGEQPVEGRCDAAPSPATIEYFEAARAEALAALVYLEAARKRLHAEALAASAKAQLEIRAEKECKAVERAAKRVAVKATPTEATSGAGTGAADPLSCAEPEAASAATGQLAQEASASVEFAAPNLVRFSSPESPRSFLELGKPPLLAALVGAPAQSMSMPMQACFGSSAGSVVETPPSFDDNLLELLTTPPPSPLEMLQSPLLSPHEVRREDTLSSASTADQHGTTFTAADASAELAAAPATVAPSDWQAVQHADTGCTYWWNSATGGTTWSDPSSIVSKPPAAAYARSYMAHALPMPMLSKVAGDEDEVHLPWTAVKDEASGKVYYWNLATQETTEPFAMVNARPVL
ncbi:hypothetical protein T492DRAFT_887100 [Pavlovales sp. CCMP2436]|nr:hypothetical protein T492DRAFT_887100 [Pavlovales sp. CCMP2436]